MRETALEYLETILRYVAGSSEQISNEELTQAVREVLQEGEKLMPTIAEQWFEQGREEGLAAGLEQGLEKGREEGREEGREVALTLLRRYLATRFGLALDHFDADFKPLDLTAVTQLSEQAFEVGTLAEFEAILAEVRQAAQTKDNGEAED